LERDIASDSPYYFSFPKPHPLISFDVSKFFEDDYEIIDITWLVSLFWKDLRKEFVSLL
jgi:hypothetical protein